MTALPDITTVAELEAVCREPAVWRAAVASIARRHGLVPGPLEALGGGNLVVAVGEAHVIKLAPLPIAREIHAEAAGLQHASFSLPLDTPRFVAAGEIDSWAYVIEERMPGRTLRQCWASVPEADRIGIMHDIGRWLAAFHTAELPRDGVLADSWSEFIEHQVAACSRRQARWGLAPAIVEGIAGYLERADPIAPTPTALLHADLTDENILLEHTGERWRISAIIDFGDARIGAPLFDLITPALLVAWGDRALLASLLDGYGIERSAHDEWLRTRLMTYAILHPFNNLTRYTSWSSEPAESIEQLADIMFPL